MDQKYLCHLQKWWMRHPLLFYCHSHTWSRMSRLCWVAQTWTESVGKGCNYCLSPLAYQTLCWSFWPPSTVKFNHQLQQLYHQNLQQLQLLITTKTPKPATTNILSSIYDTNTIPCLPPALPYKSAPGLASGANKSSRTCREGQSLRSIMTIRVICFKPLQQNSDKMWYFLKAWT